MELAVRDCILDEDYSAICGVWESSFTHSQIDSIEILSRVAERAPGLFLVAEIERYLVGVVFASYDGRQVVLHRLAVLPNYRNQGIASILCQELLNRIEIELPKPLEVLIHARNEDYIVNFYKKFGFQVVSDVCYMKKLSV